MTYMTLVKIFDPSSVVWRSDVKAFYFNFTAWADAGSPSDFSLLVADKSDAMVTGIVVLNPDFNDQHTRFWAMLKAARAKFSYSTPSGRYPLAQLIWLQLLLVSKRNARNSSWRTRTKDGKNPYLCTGSIGRIGGSSMAPRFLTIRQDFHWNKPPVAAMGYR
jgi:uncharacterized membrane protein YsdA (DUF1294 family)